MAHSKTDDNKGAGKKSASVSAKNSSRASTETLMPIDAERVANDLQTIFKDLDESASFQHVFLLSGDGAILSGNSKSVSFQGSVCTAKDADIAAFIKRKGPGYADIVAKQASADEGQSSLTGPFRACVFSYEHFVASVRVVPAQPKRALRLIVAVSKSPESFMWQYSRLNVINPAFTLANALD